MKSYKAEGEVKNLGKITPKSNIMSRKWGELPQSAG